MGKWGNDWRDWKPPVENGRVVTPKQAKAKYHNQHTVVDGIRFDSIKEAKRYQELVLLQKAGEIHQLELQVPFALKAATNWDTRTNWDAEQIAVYVADFAYYRGHELIGSTRVVEDAKGVRTPVYRIKAKIFKANYGFAITEV